MVHHTNSGIPLGDAQGAVKDECNPSNLFVPGSLRKGDIYTHTLSSNAGSNCSIYDTEIKSVRKSIERYFEFSHISYFKQVISKTFLVSLFQNHLCK